MASRVTFSIDSASVPLLPDVIDLIKQGMLTRGDKNNREYVGDSIHFNENVSVEMQSALFDPQTSGGLLISLEADNASAFLERVPNSRSIGHDVSAYSAARLSLARR